MSEILNGFGIKNFRHIRELKDVQFGDINIFVGPNSSGKSTLLKGMLMSSQVCDLGKENLLKINEVMKNPDDVFGKFHGENSLSQPLVIVLKSSDKRFHVEFEYRYDDYGVAYIFGIKVFAADDHLIFGLNEDCEFQMSLDFILKEKKFDTPGNCDRMILNSKFGSNFIFSEEDFWKTLGASLNEGVGLRYKSNNFSGLLEAMLDSPEVINSIFFEENLARLLFGDSVEILLDDSEWYEGFLSCEIGFNRMFCDEVVSLLKSILFGVAHKCSIFSSSHIYLSPHRFFSYGGHYNPLKELQISLSRDLRIFRKRDVDLSVSYKFYSKWMREFNLPLFGDKELLNQDEYFEQLVDYLESGRNLWAGYGINQLVPLFLSSGLFNRQYDWKRDCSDDGYTDLEFEIGTDGCGRIISIEEPEANLHPNFQSKLADMISESCNTFKNTFYIETHSEYLIRKFQLLKAKGMLHGLSLKIFNFNNDPNVKDDEFNFKEILIKDDGSLSDQFYPGFFDEADSIAFELYKLNRSKFN